jgi:hypothetical protein
LHILSLILTFLLLLSCGSGPKISYENPFESGLVPLDEGASAYVLIDVPNARPVVEGIGFIPSNDKNMKRMLDRTQSAALAVFSPSPEETRRFQLVSWGNYPASGSSIAFGTNKDWKKQRSAFLNSTYWHSDKAQMSVAVSSARAYVLAAMNKAPHDPIPSTGGIKIPEGFGEFGRGAVLSFWLTDPGPVLDKKLKETGIPLQIPAEQLFASLFPLDEQQYEAHVKITVANASQSKAVAAFMGIARAFMSTAVPPPAATPADESSGQNSAAMLSFLLFANPVVQEDNSLIIKTPPLDVNEIALLFSMFSL